MSSDKRLIDDQRDFFRALGAAKDFAAVRGPFEIYRYAYIERIRESIAEDFPRLFAYLERPEIALDSETVARALVEREHPTSWTIAEASLPVASVVRSVLRERGHRDFGAEASRLAAVDEAESFAAWLEEWPEPRSKREGWVAEFAADSLGIARTKTWREADSLVFWRGDNGVEQAALSEFSAFAELWPLVETPIKLSALARRAETAAEPATISNFIRRGIAEGWLKLT